MCKITSKDLYQASIKAQAMPSKGSQLVQFPAKLHDMVSSAEESGFEHVVSWLPDGKGFQIHDPEALTELLSKHFKQTKYKSFLRQLQNYGFARVIKGPNKGVCRHRFFVKGQRSLTQQIKRVNRAASPSEMEQLIKTKTVTPVRKSGTRKSGRKPKKTSKVVPQKTQSFEVSIISFQVDPEISKIPPCEILFLDEILPTSCGSSSTGLEAVTFHGQQFFVM